MHVWFRVFGIFFRCLLVGGRIEFTDIFFALFRSWCTVPCIFWRCRKNQNEISCLCNALNQPRKCWKPFLLMPIVWSYLCLLYSPHTRNSRMCRFMTHKMWTVHCHSKCPIFFFLVFYWIRKPCVVCGRKLQGFGFLIRFSGHFDFF